MKEHNLNTLCSKKRISILTEAFIIPPKEEWLELFFGDIGYNVSIERGVDNSSRLRLYLHSRGESVFLCEGDILLKTGQVLRSSDIEHMTVEEAEKK